METCSRCRGIRVHDPVESLFTIAWNTQPNSLEAEKKLLFVPTALTAGIELSDDPLPSVRAAAYAVSFARRSQPSSAGLGPDKQPSTVSP